jgi:transposase IS66 family protein
MPQQRLREFQTARVFVLAKMLADLPKAFAVIVANCLSHARRHFVDVTPNFPAECWYALETLRNVYGHDARARALGLSPEARLVWHQTHSGPLMDALYASETIWTKRGRKTGEVSANMPGASCRPPQFGSRGGYHDAQRSRRRMSIGVASRCCRMLPICGGQIGNVG